jgi:hypothetical protein
MECGRTHAVVGVSGDLNAAVILWLCGTGAPAGRGAAATACTAGPATASRRLTVAEIVGGVDITLISVPVAVIIDLAGVRDARTIVLVIGNTIAVTVFSGIKFTYLGYILGYQICRKRKPDQDC